MKRNIYLKDKLLKFAKEPVSDFTDEGVIIRINGKERIYSTQAVVTTVRKLIADRFTKLGESIYKLAAVMRKTHKLRKRDPKGMFIREK